MKNIFTNIKQRIYQVITVVLLSAGLLPSGQKVFAQGYNDKVQHYIETFKQAAMEEQLRSGVPASITLAQGILETAAGTSELCMNANNHFGIKCKNTWAGNTYTYTDDAKDECFRSYDCAQSSYKDHSDFLLNNKRYASLFIIPIDDYRGWATGLKQCGYATNPRYASQLIDAIEKYDLVQYTSRALAMQAVDPPAYASAEASPIPVTSDVYRNEVRPAVFSEKMTVAITDDGSKPDNIDYYKLTRLNGIEGFYAHKGDLLLEYAIKNKVRYSKLLELNDLFDEPLKEDMFIYLSRKNRSGRDETHTVAEGETMLIIAQDQGIQMEALRSFNKMQAGEEPMPGSVLHLKSNASQKPNIYSAGAYETVKTSYIDRVPGSSNDYVETVKLDERPRTEMENEKINYVEHEAKMAEEGMTNTAAPALGNEEPSNIAQTSAVEEWEDQKEKKKKEDKKAGDTGQENMTELDKIKAKMDRSVYKAGNNQEEDPQQVTPRNPANRSTNERVNTSEDPNRALERHMQAVESEDVEYSPKSNEDQLIKAKTTPAPAPKPAPKPVVKPTAKKTATVPKKSVAKKPVSSTAKKTTTGKKPAPKSTTTSKKTTTAAKKPATAAKKPVSSAKKTTTTSKPAAKKTAPKKK